MGASRAIRVSVPPWVATNLRNCYPAFEFDSLSEAAREVLSFASVGQMGAIVEGYNLEGFDPSDTGKYRTQVTLKASTVARIKTQYPALAHLPDDRAMLLVLIVAVCAPALLAKDSPSESKAPRTLPDPPDTSNWADFSDFD
jgi:hypothetical protein